MLEIDGVENITDFIHLLTVHIITK